MIGIIDYGIGNLASVEKALNKNGFSTVISDTISILDRCNGYILPGVGAFADGMNALKERGLIEFLNRVVEANKLLLGICLGMQLLFDSGEEDGHNLGLGFIKGTVEKIKTTYKIPHMGWNNIFYKQDSVLLEDIEKNEDFYFVHSYQAYPENEESVIATCQYGQTIPAIVASNNVFGIQFHPEKSSDKGLIILNNFGKLVDKWY